MSVSGLEVDGFVKIFLVTTVGGCGVSIGCDDLLGGGGVTSRPGRFSFPSLWSIVWVGGPFGRN